MVVESPSGPALVAEISARPIPPGSVGVWWLGQSSLVLKAGASVVYVDPYLADDRRRLSPPAMAPTDVTNADVVLLTHDHRDHVDPATLPDLAAASPGARFVAPAPIATRVADLVGDAARIVPATVGSEIRLGDTRIEAVAAKHETFDDGPDGFPHVGYVLRLGGVAVYNAGDTIPYDGLVETLAARAIDLAFLPINGRDYFRTGRGILGNMDYREAAEIAAGMGVDTVVPVHYGMFAGNTVPPGQFVSYLADHHPDVQAHVLGRRRLYLYTPPWKRSRDKSGSVAAEGGPADDEAGR